MNKDVEGFFIFVFVISGWDILEDGRFGDKGLYFEVVREMFIVFGSLVISFFLGL